MLDTKNITKYQLQKYTFRLNTCNKRFTEKASVLMSFFSTKPLLHYSLNYPVAEYINNALFLLAWHFESLVVLKQTEVQ